MSLTGLSGDYAAPNDDAEIIKVLEAKEAEQNMTQEQKEIIKLMTGNKSGLAYKIALNKTTKEIREGSVVGDNTHGN